MNHIAGNKQDLPFQNLTFIKHGRIHSQNVYVGAWAGAVLRVGRGSNAGGPEWNVGGVTVMWLGRGCNARKTLFQPFSCHPIFRVTYGSTFGQKKSISLYAVGPSSPFVSFCHLYLPFSITTYTEVLQSDVTKQGQ